MATKPTAAKAAATKTSGAKAGQEEATAPTTKATAKKATAKKATAKKATAKKATAKKATTTKAPATKTTPKQATPKKATATKASAEKASAEKASAKKATPATVAAAVKKAPARRTSSVAAGAARASGERARRRSTPLLSAPVGETGATADARPASPPAAAAQQPASKPAVAAATASSTPSDSPAAAAPTGQRSAHRPQPTVRAKASAKATRQAGIRPQSPRAKRAADEAARRHLRVAAVPEPKATRPASPDPTATQTDMSLPVPGIEELLSASIAAMRMAAQGAGISPEEIERRIASTLAFVRRRLEGDYSVDEFGYDEHFAEHVIFPMLRPIYRNWFRVEVRGLENIPDEGGALIVSNHSGTIAIDSLMVAQAIHDEHPKRRVMRALGADLVFQTPVIGSFARRGGSTLATGDDVDRLFAKGELVGVFPEGFKGVGKPFKERYKLQRFGRGGFVSAALKAGVPIIPTSVVGAEEIAPIIGNMKTVARLLGVPYAPITPTFPLLGPLGLIPLPSKWIIEFGAPIETASHGDGAADDPMLVFDLTDQVRETIQQTLYSLLMQRRSVFF
ncbi:1-acyl-sn-glycerol-3-phosphate acyltransferase [Knoellia sp. CPCC 206450]|uniref:lysophospholipid acyltransferase family protein n=1 Tax=Knoellia tibetensis TaxID=3404798 RepID=UPI003B431CFD